MLHKIKDYFTHEDRKIRDNRWIFLSMLVGAICSLIAAFVLSIEAIELAKEFRNDASPGFINGALGKLIKDSKK